MSISRGEYLAFVDSDDAITKTAIEEFYTVAKEFDADVVDCERWFQSPINGDISDKNSLRICNLPITTLVDKPTLLSDELADRINKLSKEYFGWGVVLKLIRRSVILENNLEMINAPGEDMVFTCCLVCVAKTYVRIPNCTYVYRIHEKSVMHSNTNIFSSVAEKWITALRRGFSHFDKFLSRQEFFLQNPEFKYLALEKIIENFSQYFTTFYLNVPAYKLDPFIRAEFEKSKDLPALTAYLFSRMNIFNVKTLLLQNRIFNLEKQVRNLQGQIHQIQKGRLS